MHVVTSIKYFKIKSQGKLNATEYIKTILWSLKTKQQQFSFKLKISTTTTEKKKNKEGKQNDVTFS